jgi:hypothetical protein
VLAGQAGDAAGAIFGNHYVVLALQIMLAYVVVCWMATAWWAYRDMDDRSENLILPFLASAMIILATPLLFPLALYVYKIMRPPERLADVYERNLSQEALLAEVEKVVTCRQCDKRVEPEWLVCPFCRARLNRICPSCKGVVGLDWSLCAWCAAEFPHALHPEGS